MTPSSEEAARRGDTAGATITNYLLFNHTYLRRLQADSSVDEQASLAAQGVRDWHGFRDDSSVHSMVDSWVGPLLNTLELELQPLEPGDARVHLLYTAWDHATPVGFCYVTPPGADLDTTTKGEHWMAEAVLAARRWKPAEGRGTDSEAEDQERHALRWVILTNGDQWRLLDAQALRRYEAYLQVNLEELVRDRSDLSALRVFYRCFHRSAFERDAEGESGLDRLLDASSRATKKAEDHLKACVSANEGVMAQLCLGLVESTGKDRFTEEERDAIYRDATYLLYRMLFILYAEARDLLPMGNPAYRQRSLTRLVETAHKYKLKGIPDPKATTLWERVKDLCNAIYESDETLGIPAYNGGLFDDTDKPYLRDGTIADGHLTWALFDLAYQPDGDVDDGYRRIDYRDLSVRHLGSIYEGMIEYKLQIAEETLWARRDGKGNVRFLKTGQDGAPRRNDVKIEKGDVYFSQSPGERRATGTYYTPEYIVDYIVRQTVVRGLEERRASLDGKLAVWLEEVAAAIDTSERRRMQRTADEELLRFVEEEVLTFRVCDPAMGSGHFLVNATHHMTGFIVETLHLTSWAGHEIDVDPNAWRRSVVERCLYGVDISLMAVELAKLSLWLASVAEGKPLSFLDHHLRQGNSLIGARLEDLAGVLMGKGAGRSKRERKAREAGQLSMLDDPSFSQHLTAATDLLAQISARVAKKVEDVKAQAAHYEQVRAELDPYRRLADLWVSRYFGMDVDEQQLRAVSQYLTKGAVSEVPHYDRLLKQIDELANDHAFFHWELEFPEPFLDHEQRLFDIAAGFDAVTGNPPYVDSETMTNSLPIFRRYCTEQWVSASGNWDMFVVFVELGIKLARESGRSSLIVPNKLLGAEYCTAIQSVLRSREIESIRDYSRVKVFEEAAVYPIVYVVRNRQSSAGEDILLSEMAQMDSGHRMIARKQRVPTTVLERLPVGYWWPIFSPYVGILSKCLAVGVDLGDIAEVLGAATVSEAYQLADLIEEEPSAGSSHRDYLRFVNTGTIDRYAVLWGLSATNYIKRRFQRPVMREQTLAEILPARYEQANNPKIILAGMVQRLEACYDQSGAMLAGKSTVVVRNAEFDLAFILAVINSKLGSLFYRETFGALALQGGYLRVGPPQVEKIPIYRVTSVTPADRREQLAQEARQCYGYCMTVGDKTSVIGLVEHQLRQEPQRADVVCDLLAYLAQQMIDLNKERQRLEQKVNLFRIVGRDTPCLPLDKALGGPLGAGKMVRDRVDPSVAHHDIEGLRLTQKEDDRWLLEVRAKLRDPEADWREHQRDADGNFIRRWLPVYRLPLDEATGRFYHYAFANLDGFDGAGKFPGGFTRTTLKKLHLTRVPRFVPVDLEPLAALDAELADVRHRIQITDDLIDQIVYRLYGLTEEEIAIVEGRA